MCNLYSLNKGQDALKRFFKVTQDDTGNMPPLPGIFPDTMAPVIRQRGDERVMQMMRWGFPSPPDLGNRPVTNVRNLKSIYWRGWLKSESRCLVPATSFCEWTDASPKVTHWFEIGEDRPLFAFAGIWRSWSGMRSTKAAPVAGEHRLYSFLTTAPNAIVKPIHSKAMPVLLTTPDECDAWLTAAPEDALKLQRPLPDDALRIVARGEKEDG